MTFTRLLQYVTPHRTTFAYGRHDATNEAIEKAARVSGAHEFISLLPGGYDTIIGDQGVRLSGGQRQRLSLARTLLTDPPILILDEATAMFDPQGEEDFISDCASLIRDRTVILITHRPASVALADRVLNMEDLTTRVVMTPMDAPIKLINTDPGHPTRPNHE
jgi:ATP-binding cassette subfamily B protein